MYFDSWKLQLRVYFRSVGFFSRHAAVVVLAEPGGERTILQSAIRTNDDERTTVSREAKTQGGSNGNPQRQPSISLCPRESSTGCLALFCKKKSPTKTTESCFSLSRSWRRLHCKRQGSFREYPCLFSFFTFHTDIVLLAVGRL